MTFRCLIRELLGNVRGAVLGRERLVPLQGTYPAILEENFKSSGVEQAGKEMMIWGSQGEAR